MTDNTYIIFYAAIDSYWAIQTSGDSRPRVLGRFSKLADARERFPQSKAYILLDVSNPVHLAREKKFRAEVRECRETYEECDQIFAVSGWSSDHDG